MKEKINLTNNTNQSQALRILKIQSLKTHTFKKSLCLRSKDNPSIKLIHFTLIFYNKSKVKSNKKESHHHTKIFKDLIFTNLPKDICILLETSDKILRDHLQQSKCRIVLILK